MSLFLTLAFLFFVGSVSGWVLELFFRRFISSGNPDRKWINPGFCTGPYLPLYGVGLCILYLIASVEQQLSFSYVYLQKIALFFIMAICLTAVEYLAGIICIKLTKVRLWDYSDEWGNIQGIICPKFSFFWSILGALYCFLVHPYINNALDWFSKNLAFSFVIGMFFGIFIIDVLHSVQIVAKLKRYAEENNVIVRYEAIKNDIRSRYEKSKEKYHFFRPFRSDIPLSEHLSKLHNSFEQKRKIKNK